MNKMRALQRFLILQSALILACSNSPEEKTEAIKTANITYTGKIIALGDSLTEGFGVPEKKNYPSRLQTRLVKDKLFYKVINAGINGETTSGLSSRIDWIIAQKPDIVILASGANDGLRGISPALIEKNLNAVILKLKKRKIGIVFCGMKMVRNMGVDYTFRYDGIFPRVALHHRLIFMPFFLEGVGGDERLNLKDGIHPTGDGYQIIVERLYPYVRKAITAHQKNTRTPNSSFSR